MMCLTEYDEEATMRAFRKEGFEDGRLAGKEEKAVEAAVMLITDYNVDPKIAAEKMNAPLDSVLEALKSCR